MKLLYYLTILLECMLLQQVRLIGADSNVDNSSSNLNSKENGQSSLFEQLNNYTSNLISEDRSDNLSITSSNILTNVKETITSNFDNDIIQSSQTPENLVSDLPIESFVNVSNIILSSKTKDEVDHNSEKDSVDLRKEAYALQEEQELLKDQIKLLENKALKQNEFLANKTEILKQFNLKMDDYYKLTKDESQKNKLKILSRAFNFKKNFEVDNSVLTNNSVIDHLGPENHYKNINIQVNLTSQSFSTINVLNTDELRVGSMIMSIDKLILPPSITIGSESLFLCSNDLISLSKEISYIYKKCASALGGCILVKDFTSLIRGKN